MTEISNDAYSPGGSESSRDYTEYWHHHARGDLHLALKSMNVGVNCTSQSPKTEDSLAVSTINNSISQLEKDLGLTIKQ